jgi:hypothetical protein
MRGTIPKRGEEAAVVCAECGLREKVTHSLASSTMLTFLDYATSRRLCRMSASEFMEKCPWWAEAQLAAVQQLRPQTD